MEKVVGISVEINPDEINKKVSEAVMNSAIGPAIKDCIEDTIKSLSDKYRSPIHSIIQKIIFDEVKNIIMSEEYINNIKDHVKVIMTDEYIKDVVERFFLKIRNWV